MNPEPSLWIGSRFLWFRRGLFSSGGPWKNKSSNAEVSLSFFFEISMITTLGATVSNTLAKALFNWWTTSLPCSAAAAGIVGVGASSGVAARIGTAFSATIRNETENKRIGSKLDSIEHATFNTASPLGWPGMGIAAARNLTNGIVSVGLSPDMRSLNLNRVSVGILAALFVLAAAWLASERQPPKPISAVEFVRAMETQQTSLIDRYFRQHHDPNARGANDRSLLFTAVLREDPIVARRLLDAGASADLADNAGVTPLMVAAMHGDLELLRAMAGRVTDIAARDRAGHSALYYAVAAQKIEG